MTVLGGGSNVLIADTGLRGLVIRDARRRGRAHRRGPHSRRRRRHDQRPGAVDDQSRRRGPRSVGRHARHRRRRDPRQRAFSRPAHQRAHRARDARDARRTRSSTFRRRTMEFGYDYSRLHRTREVVVSADFRVTDGQSRRVARHRPRVAGLSQAHPAARVGQRRLHLPESRSRARRGAGRHSVVGRRARRSRGPQGRARGARACLDDPRELHRQRGRRQRRRHTEIWSSGASATYDRGSASACAKRSVSYLGFGSSSVRPERRTPNCRTRTTRQDTRMATLRIEGGRRLEGRVAVEGNKNAALPLLAACLLTDQECVLTNVPRIRDVEVLIDLLVGLGATVDGTGDVDASHPLRDGDDRPARSRARGPAARIRPAARSAARAPGLGASRAAGRRLSGAADDLDPPAGARGDGGGAARRAGARARRAVGADRGVVLPRRGVGDRHRDRAPRRRRGEGPDRDPARRHGASRRRALPVPARDGRVDRRRGHVHDSRRGAGPLQGRDPPARRRLHRSRELGRRRRDHRRRHRSDRRALDRPRSRRRPAQEDGPASARGTTSASSSSRRRA